MFFIPHPGKRPTPAAAASLQHPPWQVAYGWNLQNQTALPVLLECQARGIEVVLAGVLFFGENMLTAQHFV